MSGCARHNHIDFSSSEAFFSSLNKNKTKRKEDISNNTKLNNFKKSKINSTKKNKINNAKRIIKKPLPLM